MLISFRVTNFRAFKESQELSLRRERQHASGEPNESQWDTSISTAAAIYGAEQFRDW